MSRLQENEDPVRLDDRLIDRLVDGALPDAERRAVLARLKVEPGAWRRCALAFLEAQSWREALSPLVVPASGERPVLVPEQAGGRLGVPWLTAIAAGLLAAFALGWSARGVAPGEAAGGSLTKAEIQAAAPSPPVLAKPAVAPRPEPSAIRSAPGAAPLPEQVVRAWERRGYQVEQSQRLVSMELKNGRRVAVPIDEVRVRFIGHRTY
jgi:hypothetical protein